MREHDMIYASIPAPSSRAVDARKNMISGNVVVDRQLKLVRTVIKFANVWLELCII